MLALVLAFDACVDAVVALVAAAVAEVAAAVADVVADAASTNKSYFAEFAFVVSGCAPDDVCAEFTINILFFHSY